MARRGETGGVPARPSGQGGGRLAQRSAGLAATMGGVALGPGGSRAGVALTSAHGPGSGTGNYSLTAVGQ